MLEIAYNNGCPVLINNTLIKADMAHNGDAVVGVSCAVVEVLFAAQISTPVREECHILPLYFFPNHFLLCCWIVRGDFCKDFFLTGLGIQHMTAGVKFEFVVLHSFRFLLTF